MTDDERMNSIIDHLYGEMEPETEEKFLEDAIASKHLSKELAETRKLLTAYRLAPASSPPEGVAAIALKEAALHTANNTPLYEEPESIHEGKVAAEVVSQIPTPKAEPEVSTEESPKKQVETKTEVEATQETAPAQIVTEQEKEESKPEVTEKIEPAASEAIQEEAEVELELEQDESATEDSEKKSESIEKTVFDPENEIEGVSEQDSEDTTEEKEVAKPETKCQDNIITTDFTDTENKKSTGVPFMKVAAVFVAAFGLYFIVDNYNPQKDLNEMRSVITEAQSQPEIIEDSLKGRKLKAPKSLDPVATEDVSIAATEKVDALPKAITDAVVIEESAFPEPQKSQEGKEEVVVKEEKEFNLHEEIAAIPSISEGKKDTQADTPEYDKEVASDLTAEIKDTPNLVKSPVTPEEPGNDISKAKIGSEDTLKTELTDKTAPVAESKKEIIEVTLPEVPDDFTPRRKSAKMPVTDKSGIAPIKTPALTATPAAIPEISETSNGAVFEESLTAHEEEPKKTILSRSPAQQVAESENKQEKIEEVAPTSQIAVIKEDNKVVENEVAEAVTIEVQEESTAESIATGEPLPELKPEVALVAKSEALPEISGDDSLDTLLSKAQVLYDNGSYITALFAIEEAMEKPMDIGELEKALTLKGRIELKLNNLTPMATTIERLRGVSPVAANALNTLRSAALARQQSVIIEIKESKSVAEKQYNTEPKTDTEDLEILEATEIRSEYATPTYKTTQPSTRKGFKTSTDPYDRD